VVNTLTGTMVIREGDVCRLWSDFVYPPRSFEVYVGELRNGPLFMFYSFEGIHWGTQTEDDVELLVRAPVTPEPKQTRPSRK